MSKKLKKVFKTKEKAFDEGKEVEREVELAVRVPSSLEKQKARLVYARAWREAVEAGAIMRDALDRYLRDQKLWDDIRQKEYDRLRKQILESTRKLSAGGNAGLTKKQARDLSLQVIDWRDELSELLSERNRVDANTADALADQSQFNFLVAACTVYNESNKPYFTVTGSDYSPDVYLEKANERVGVDAATNFAEIWYGVGTEDNVDKLPVEQKVLRELGFADDKGRLIDKQGRLIDRKGRLINEEGRFIDENNDLVDADGNRVDSNGEYIIEFAPFLDDEGDDGKEEYVKANGVGGEPFALSAEREKEPALAG